MSLNGILWLLISNDLIDPQVTHFVAFYGRFKEIGLLLIASIVLIFSIIWFIYFIVTKKVHSKINKIMYCLIILSSILGLCTLTTFILTVNNVATQNFYILACKFW
jgi:hypothetical protein